MSFVYRWLSEYLNFNILTCPDKLFVLAFLLLIIFFYRKNLRTLLVLLLGVIFFSWPGVVAYPNPRYINAVYPFLIFIFIYGIYLFSKESITLNVSFDNKYIKLPILILCLSLGALSIWQGVYKTIGGIKNGAESSLIYKSKFEQFFKENKFNKSEETFNVDVNFIIFGVPFASDIKHVFQVFLNDLNLQVAHIRHSSLACRGSMGCRQDYKIKDVKSEIIPVKEDGKIGFRLVSLDEKHCGWWMSFSNFPLKWSAQERAYIWSDKLPEIDKWHDYSMGKFKIHKRLPTKQIIDVTFLIDDKWIDKNTVFVTWDTVTGRYIIINLV